MGERLKVIKENLWTDHAKKGRMERLKIWEIDKFFKCPIVGACLTLCGAKASAQKMRNRHQKQKPL
jgi:hypothetical protein